MCVLSRDMFRSGKLRRLPEETSSSSSEDESPPKRRVRTFSKVEDLKRTYSDLFSQRTYMSKFYNPVAGTR